MDDCFPKGSSVKGKKQKMETSLRPCPPVLASIVTWNHAPFIEACIESVLQQTYPALRIVVYDNASSDGTRQVLEKYRERVELVYSPENRGFCGGHNTVISTQSD